MSEIKGKFPDCVVTSFESCNLCRMKDNKIREGVFKNIEKVYSIKKEDVFFLETENLTSYLFFLYYLKNEKILK